MDDTTLGSPSPALPPTSAPVARGLPRRGLVAAGAAVAVAGLLGVAACGAGSSDNGSSDNGSSPKAAQAAVPSSVDGQFGSAQRDAAFSASSGGALSPLIKGQSSGLIKISAEDFGRSQIKTAQLGLRSKTITTVMTQIENVASGQNGFVASENTVTDVHGRATSSSISIRVPVDSFEAAIADVLKLGQVSSRRISTQDVTGRVADVASRVTSAKDSIAQLRVLFSHAVKLSDIITLESELSDREADLESLLAQQRALTNATTLSTISVQVSRPPTPMTITAVHHDKSTGFVGGLKQGWNALADTFVAVSHGLGAALPLGLSILVILGLLWAGVRRLPKLPKRHVEASE
jgi:Domain of unknown function (DUF4349)